MPDLLTGKIAAAVSPHLDLRELAQAGERRAKALKTADDELDRIVELVRGAGDNANLTLAAKIAGVSRQTLYSRLGR